MPHEIVEEPPEQLDCGHPTERNVIIGYNRRPGTDQRARTYECRTCGTVTYVD
jgi:hypothetical protein